IGWGGGLVSLVHGAEGWGDEVLGVFQQQFDLARWRRELAFGMWRAPIDRTDVDPVVAVLLEVLHVDTAHLGIGPIYVGGAQLAVGHFEDRIVKAHLGRE